MHRGLIALAACTAWAQQPPVRLLNLEFPGPHEHTGTVRIVRENQVVLETPDHRYLTLTLPESDPPVEVGVGDHVFFEHKGKDLESARVVGRTTDVDLAWARLPVPNVIYDRLGMPKPPAPLRSLPPHADPVIANAQRATLAYLAQLPSYLARQTTKRREGAPGKRLHQQDVIECDVAVHQGLESYRNFRRNGLTLPAGGRPEGTWSAGEFRSLVLMVLTNRYVAYSGRATQKVNGRPALRYDLHVPQRHSEWQLHVDWQLYQPEYRGRIWIDRDTSRVARLELEAVGLPKDFPMTSAATTAEHGFVTIRNQRHWLPRVAVIAACNHEIQTCTRNEIRFSRFSAYRAESSIIFEEPVK